MTYLGPLPRYDLASHERLIGLERRAMPWTRGEVEAELVRRVRAQMCRRELHVHYYRIGYPLAFPLPLRERPHDLPQNIPGIRTYPWLIWVGWALEERWRVLHTAANLGDAGAGRLLGEEIAALGEWDSFDADNGEAGLVTAALAGCLSMLLADSLGNDTNGSRTTATRLLSDSVVPWFERAWAGSGTPEQTVLHNIRVITLVRGAQLAQLVTHAATEPLTERARAVLEAWCEYRLGPVRHTEGAAYDGFLLDHLTDWIDTAADRTTLLETGATAFSSAARDWTQLTLPGRVDLLAPLGDVEAEMPFWATVLTRFARWYDDTEVAAFVRRFPLARLPGAGLVGALELATPAAGDTVPSCVAREQPAAVTLRTGWDADDLLVAVSTPRTPMRHLHADAGHVVVGWQGRFWVTDPGYQQYRHDAERDYTLDADAHNAPVVDGQPQVARRARVVEVAEDGHGQRVDVDLTDCYDDLPADATVRRVVWLSARPRSVVVRDDLVGLSPGATIATSWLGGTDLSWAFVDGWARIGDGTRALWLGTASPGTSEPDPLGAGHLVRHPGSRGPLTLRVSAPAHAGNQTRWWFLSPDPNGGWQPPAVSWREGEPRLGGYS